MRSGYSIEGGTARSVWDSARTPEDTWEGADTLSYVAGAHSIKLGGGMKYVSTHTVSLPFGFGCVFLRRRSRVLYPQPFAFYQGLAPLGRRR